MTNKLKCAVVDDDLGAIEALKDLCRDSSFAEITYGYTSSEKFLKEYGELNFDVCFFDIVMPGVNGLILAQEIQDKPVILMTGVIGKLIDAIDMVAPVDVLRKPVKKERFEKAIQKAHQHIIGKNKGYSVQKISSIKSKEYESFNSTENGRKVMIRLSDICFVTADLTDPRHKNVLMKDGKKYTVTNCTMEKLLKAAPNLIQINKSELVSIDSIRGFERDIVVVDHFIENGKQKQVPLGRRFREQFLTKISIL